MENMMQGNNSMNAVMPYNSRYWDKNFDFIQQLVCKTEVDIVPVAQWQNIVLAALKVMGSIPMYCQYMYNLNAL